MRYRDEKDTIGVYHGSGVMASIYHGLRLVWELITSCFGRGYWIGEAPFVNEDGWKNQ